MRLWLVMLAGGVLTYATRMVFILLFGRFAIPELVRRALRFVPPAVLTAIIFPEILLPGGELLVSWQNPRLAAGLLAALVAWRTRSIVLTIVVGMVAMLVWGALVGGG